MRKRLTVGGVIVLGVLVVACTNNVIGGGDEDRLLAIRAGDTIIDDDDYLLMAADNTVAQDRAGTALGEATTGRWYRIKPGSDLSMKSFPNSHGMSLDGGKTYVTDDAYLMIPRPEYRGSPEEVVWYLRRILELRKDGIEQAERGRIIAAERQREPWLKDIARHDGEEGE